MRAKLAWAALGLLAATILLGMAMVWSSETTVEEIRLLFEPIIPAEVALASGATGYYFGGRSSEA